MKNPKPKEWFNLYLIYLMFFSLGEVLSIIIHPQLDNIRLIKRLILGDTPVDQLMEVAYVQLPGSQQITSKKSILNPEIFRSVGYL